jgi:DNA-binding transcriptional regulator YhcF (GntR family)
MANPRKKRRQTGAPAKEAQNTGASQPGAAPDPAGAKVHSFSRAIAQEHGEKAAVLLQYLAHHVSKSKNVHGGRKWFYKTLDDLAAVFPYLKRSTIHDALALLKGKRVLRIGDFNKKGYDRTCWYAFEDDNVRKQAQSLKPAYFQVEDAVKYGIVAAVLLGNLEHWIRENRKTDPGYTWHSVSPRELARHLPFPKTTLQRALADLVENGVIKAKEPEVKGGATQYALVDEERLAVEERGGPISDMGGGPNLDEGGPVSDMGGPKSDMPGPNPDMGGPISDNNTTLIENPLKDDPLKDPSYVERGLPDNQKHTSKTDKLKGVKGVHPFRSIPAFGAHTPNPMSGKGTGSLQSAKSEKSPKSSSSVSSGQSTVATSSPSAPTSQPTSAVPSAELPVATSSPSAQTSQPLRAAPQSRIKLSRSLESTFIKYNKGLKEMRPVTAQSAVTLALDWIILFFQDAKPEELAEFLRIRDQETLYDKLAELFAPHLAKHLERFSTTKERKLLAQFSSQLVMQFLTQAFCQYIDERYVPVGSADSYRVHILLRQKLRPFFDALEKKHQETVKAQQQATLNERADHYASPDKAKESTADLSAAEKVQVLRNSLASRNNIGAFNERNQLHHQVVDYNNRTLDAAYEFFKANPDFTVADLNKVVEKCLPLPKEPSSAEGTDPLWHARKASDNKGRTPLHDAAFYGHTDIAELLRQRGGHD